MQMETEISVLVKTDYEKLQKELKENNFLLKEEYVVNDIYMIDENVNISNMSYLDILKKCILVRDIVGFEKVLLYKYKKYAENGDILEQGKVRCPITDVDKAVKFMETIHYKRLFDISDKCIVYANDKSELVVQLVNDKYIFIEMESTGDYIDREYRNVEEMKSDLLSYNLSIDESNFFVKKAEIMLKEILEK
ncbi:MAG: hypothetical protein KIC90_06270 [Firmicutes bacterium]|jgi:hypothetical protein|nr:hypothetical protein [Bacillota bacterium]